MSPALLSKNTSSSTPLCEVTLEERLRCCQPPQARPVGYHHWSDLLFLHWRVPAEMLQPLLPRGLTVDTWDGSAWVGLVAFHISRLRPWWSPVLPWISTFPETNIRTYVHREGRDPAVWFFSLDAARWLAVQAARDVARPNTDRADLSEPADSTTGSDSTHRRTGPYRCESAV